MAHTGNCFPHQSLKCSTVCFVETHMDTLTHTCVRERVCVGLFILVETGRFLTGSPSLTAYSRYSWVITEESLTYSVCVHELVLIMLWGQNSGCSQLEETDIVVIYQ